MENKTSDDAEQRQMRRGRERMISEIDGKGDTLGDYETRQQSRRRFHRKQQELKSDSDSILIERRYARGCSVLFFFARKCRGCSATSRSLSFCRLFLARDRVSMRNARRLNVHVVCVR